MKLHISCILLIFFNMQFIFSVEKSKKDTFSIDEVYVTRVRPAEREISAASLQSVTSKELELISGSTVADAIKNFSGTQVKDYGGIGGLKTVMVRSLGSNHTGVFLDGVQFSDAASGQVDLGKINIDNAESVSLIIGESPKTLQTARMYSVASVLSIESSDISSIQKPVAVKANFKTGSFGMVNPSFCIQNKWDNNLFSNVSVSYSKADGIYRYKINKGNINESWDYRKNSGIEFLNVNTDILFKLSNKSSISGKIYYYDSNRGLPAAVGNPSSSQELWNRDFFMNLKFKNSNHEKLQWLTNAKFSQNYLRYSDPDFFKEGGLDNRYTQQEFYISQALAYNIYQKLKLAIATDIVVNHLMANEKEYATPTRFTSLTALSANWSYKIVEVHGNILNTMVREETELKDAASSRDVLTPTLGCSILVWKDLSLRVRFLYKDIFRMPTFNDLYYNQFGNTNLKPEWAKQFSTGFSAYAKLGILEYISIKAEVYQNIVKDKIVAIPTKNIFLWSMQNIGLVNIKGIETNFSLQTSSFWGIKYNTGLNYSYQKAVDVSENSLTYNQQIPYIPLENLSALQSFSIKSFSISWNSLYSGYRYFLGENNYNNMLPSWWTQDVAFIYKKDLKAVSLKCKAEITNIFNAQYEVVQSFPMPGRAFSLTLTLNY